MAYKPFQTPHHSFQSFLSVRIRRYVTADQQAALSIWLAASRMGHPFLSEADLAAQEILVRDVYLPKAETWVAEREGAVIGFIGLLDSFIGGLFIAPGIHGTGVGRALVEHAATLKGSLTVEVYADNPMAPNFYRRCGFIESGRKPQDDEGRPLELIVMSRAST